MNQEYYFSEDSRELFSIAIVYLLEMNETILKTDHIVYTICRRQDLFYSAYRRARYFSASHFFSIDKLPNKEPENYLCNIDKVSYSNELRESISIAAQKARERGTAELTPELIFYGILKNPNTMSHQSLIKGIACGKSGLPKIIDGYFWGIMFEEDGWGGQAKDHYRQGRYKKAIDFCMKALEIAPDDPHSLYQTVLCLKKLKRFSEVLKYSDRLLEMDPYCKKFLWDRMISLFYLGRIQELFIMVIEMLKNRERIS